MVNVKPYFVAMALIITASCAPLDQKPLDIEAPQPLAKQDTKPTIPTAPQSDNQSSAPLENTDTAQTAIAPSKAADTTPPQTDEAILSDNRTVPDNKSAALTMTDDEMTASENVTQDSAENTQDETQKTVSDNLSASVIQDTAPKPIVIKPAPKPIEPLNPVIFTGLTIKALEKRLGRPDRQFAEQGLTIWHYEEAHCLALFFIHDTGDSADILHVDLRAAMLQKAFSQRRCFADFGQRAEALLSPDKR